MDRTRAGTVAVFAVLLSLWSCRSEPGASVELPAELATYPTWQRLLQRPHEAPYSQWILCGSPTTDQRETALKQAGPHAQRYIMVYGNPQVMASSRQPFAPGAVIAKEKLLRSDGMVPEGVAFMIKRGKSEFPDTNGWEFTFYPSAGDRQKTHEQCASCHRSAAAKDYVFGKYPE